MNKYILHSHIADCFHFRKNPDSAMESFSITYCHDGTVCMTGDYGCLVWRRELFPKRPDYGFPNRETWIKYFAEKVIRAEDDQKIKTWRKELAAEEIKEDIKTYQEDRFTSGVEVLEKVLERLELFEDGDYGYFQMLEAFNEVNNCLESEDFYHYGRDYTDSFKMKFRMIIYVSDAIIAEVLKDRDSSSG